MKRLLFKVVMVNILIISTLNSCNKDDSLPVPGGGGGGSSSESVTYVASNWESKGNGTFVNVFSSILSAANSNQSLGIYLVKNGKDISIDQPISFMDGQLWATHTVTDVIINFRGNLSPSILDIKIVFQ